MGVFHRIPQEGRISFKILSSGETLEVHWRGSSDLFENGTMGWGDRSGGGMADWKTSSEYQGARDGDDDEEEEEVGLMAEENERGGGWGSDMRSA